MTLFGSPAILALPAGFHTMTTKIWSLFQFPPKPELAAAASLPLLLMTVMLLRAEHMLLGRRGYSVVGGKRRRAAARARSAAGAGRAFALCLRVLCCPVFLPYGALVNAAFSRGRLAAADGPQFHLHNVHFVFFELSATKLALKNTVPPRARWRRPSARSLALVIAYLTARQAVTGHRVLGFLATAPIAIPGIVLGVGCSSATRGRRSCSTARCGSC